MVIQGENDSHKIHSPGGHQREVAVAAHGPYCDGEFCGIWELCTWESVEHLLRGCGILTEVLKKRRARVF